jgi:hypothetical protein
MATILLTGANGNVASVGDLERPRSLEGAFDGVDAALLLCPPGPLAPYHTSNALWAARQAGVKHVVRASAIGAAHDAPTLNGRLHALSDDEARRIGKIKPLFTPSHPPAAPLPPGRPPAGAAPHPARVPPATGSPPPAAPARPRLASAGRRRQAARRLPLLGVRRAGRGPGDGQRPTGLFPPLSFPQGEGVWERFSLT